MSKPYAIISDIHFHNWQAFSKVGEDGINNRLQYLLDEVKRAADELIKEGGNTLFVAGDLFHVRGSIAPSVLNPVLDLFQSISDRGVFTFIIPGNHDLEGKHSSDIGNAVRALKSIHSISVIEKPEAFATSKVIMLPWVEDLEELRKVLNGNANPDYDVIIHAPLNGVIPGLPDKGLSTEELLNFGYKRVFAGHYHNYKELAPNHAVTSIGAIAHHSWSDVNSKAGFLLVYPDKVVWRASRAPKFIDLTSDIDKEEAELLVDGNYVRASLVDSKVETSEQVRKWLVDNGAKGVVLRYIKESVARREGSVSASIKSGASMQESISEFISQRFKDLGEEKLKSLNVYAQKILAEAAVI